jgi:hypothetical protein
LYVYLELELGRQLHYKAPPEEKSDARKASVDAYKVFVRGFQLGTMWRFRASEIDGWISVQREKRHSGPDVWIYR